jgi:hypothetical protein
MRLTIIAPLAAVMLTACRDRQAITPPAAVVPAAPPSVPAPHSVYLTVSNLAPDIGSEIVVAANVRLDNSISVASFLAHLDYDATMLTYMGEDPGSDMMHVVNPQVKQITVAAASAQGSASGVLFRLRFRVDDPAGLGSLSLRLDDLNDVNYQSQVASMRLLPTLLLDRSLSSRAPKQ